MQLPTNTLPVTIPVLAPGVIHTLKGLGGGGAMVWTSRVPQNPMLKLNLKMMVLGGGAFEERLGRKNGR